MRKIIVAAALGVAALGITSCGSKSPPVVSAPATHATSPPAASSVTATITPTATPTAAGPAGIWTATSTSDPSDVYGQYSITESDGQYTLTTNTALRLAGSSPGGCSLPSGTYEGTFSHPAGASTGTYTGTEKLWYVNTCGYASTGPFTIQQLSGNTMVMTDSVTLTRLGSAPIPSASPSPSPSSSAPVAQGSCNPADSPDSGTVQAENILTGNGYHPVNSIVDTSETVTIIGGALGVDSTGAEAVLILQAPDASFIVGVKDLIADHHSPVKVAADACGAGRIFLFTGSEANVITLLDEDAYGTNPLPSNG
jgi:hypothetical protein